MAKKTKHETPNEALSRAQQDLMQERKLNEHLDRIIAQEKVRNEASDKIKAIWRKIETEGFNIPEARSALVRRACAV